MGRILALDYGNKRTGVAVSDPLKIIASPMQTIHSKDIFTFLEQYTINEQVETIVVGMPKNLDLTDTDSSVQVANLVKALQRKFPQIEIATEDERFTSSIAKQTLHSMQLRKKDKHNKSNLDKISASLILQTYLQRQQL